MEDRVNSEVNKDIAINDNFSPIKQKNMDKFILIPRKEDSWKWSDYLKGGSERNSATLTVSRPGVSKTGRIKLTSPVAERPIFFMQRVNIRNHHYYSIYNPF